MLASWFRYARTHVLQIVGVLFIASLFASAMMTVTTFGALHYTAQPQFCTTCHLMDPFYESWQNSPHGEVACIECHYQPGAIETFEGKFEALSQVAKYLTRTAGTKPWAEVSDASCLRSGCHAVTQLDGALDFDGVAFDHKPHLFESRPGRRLRCVTCHSQIVQTEHISVSPEVCITCHFAVGADPEHGGNGEDCLSCHEVPHDELDVHGKPFRHDEYVARGVACEECHDPVTEGQGTVRMGRCKSCHGEPEFFARFEETAFLHETHITRNKVECFECHDEIRHGLLEPMSLAEGSNGNCGTCHADPHTAALQLYAGTGAHGVEERPSRMFQTRVVCSSCHTGRSQQKRGSVPHDAVHAAGGVATAGNVDCIHCHGTGYDGMLANWQSTVGAQLERLKPMVEELGVLVDEQADGAARALYEEARHNVELVALDGSRGAHNLEYALDALRAGAERVDQAHELLGRPSAESALSGFGLNTPSECASCHANIGAADGPLERAGGFPHGPHLDGAGLDCSSCHTITEPGLPEHGRLSIGSDQCASCHHGGQEGVADVDCGACHDTQAGMLAGALPGHDLATGVMAAMECSDCHGEPPDMFRPNTQQCVLCHEEGFDRIGREWQAAVAEQIARLVPMLEETNSATTVQTDEETREALRQARMAIELVVRDGSRGAHNVHGALTVLKDAAARIDAARAGLELRNRRLASDFPLSTEHGCETCHAGIGRPPEVSSAEFVFPHRRHMVAARLDCADCHSVEDHGAPASNRANCLECHHRESSLKSAGSCESCHAPQTGMLRGELAGFDPVPGTMAELRCKQCHGEPPSLNPKPSPRLCVLCHERGYDDMQGEWQRDVEARVAEVRRAIDSSGAAPERIERARSALRAVLSDRSRGVHNHAFAVQLLEGALAGLE